MELESIGEHDCPASHYSGSEEEILDCKSTASIFRMVPSDSACANEFVLVQYMKRINAVVTLDESLVCVTLRWSTDSVNYHTRRSQAVQEKRILPAVGDWAGVQPFDSIQGRVSVGHTNYGNEPLTEVLQLVSKQILHVNVIHPDRITHE